MKAKRNVGMILANTAAMQAAIALSDTVDTTAILAMHRALMSGEPRHTPGESRTEPVWIGGGSTPVGMTSHRWPRSLLPMHNSIRSTRSPTATDAQGGRWCRQCCATRG